MQNAPLAGICILDFTRILAGPLCTMLLGDLGADVIKIEQPEFGDDTRSWGPPFIGDPNDGLSAYFVSINRNKRSLTLNLKSDEGQKIGQQLAAQSHIVIENFRTGQMQEYGLDYATLSGSKPELVYCSITGFGQTGPLKDRAGYDFIIQAMSGLMSITGPVEGEGYKTGVAVSDVFTALYASNAIQAALRQAEQTDKGQYIDISLFESQLAALVNIGSTVLVSGSSPQRYGNQHATIVPYQVFQAQDKPFVMGVGNDRQFVKLCKLLGHSELSADPRFVTNPQRVKHRDTLISVLAEIFAQDTAQTWLDRLESANIPAGPINTVDEAFNDPHTREREFVQQTTIGDNPLKLAGLPFHFSDFDADIRYPPPQLGQQTEEILSELCDLNLTEIERLRAQGII